MEDQAARFASALVPAAQYVRMSTEHQRYSADNQAAAIELYAAARGYEVVQTYADLGKSGLTLERRPELQRLLCDVQQPGYPGFRAVLVYDVSRWGRFQDPDEGAVHEQTCKRAGMAVHYCAEQFENDGSIIATVLKSIKRAMAAEYSRELSIKVGASHRRGVALGFVASRWAPLGTRRMLVDAQGRHVRLLAAGEGNMRGHRVTLVLGPAHEREWARRMFSMYGRLGWPMSRIARTLNTAGVINPQGGRWTYGAVRNVLRSEIYIGNIVYGRTTSRLAGPKRQVPQSEWARGEGVLPATVSRILFDQVQARLAIGARPREDVMIQSLSDLLTKHGRLSRPLIDAEPGIPASATYLKHFGSMIEAYHRVGYEPADHRSACHLKASVSARGSVLAEVCAAVAATGRAIVVDHSQARVHVDDAFAVDVRACSPKVWPGRSLFWIYRDLRRIKPPITLIARLDQAHGVRDYCLATCAGFRGRRDLRLPAALCNRDGLEILPSLEGFYERCLRALALVPSNAVEST